MKSTLTDKEQIDAIRLRNEFQIGSIYKQYRGEFLQYFTGKHFKREDDVLDIYQDAFLELCLKIQENKLNESNLTCSLKTYLFGIGKFMFLAQFRKKNNKESDLFTEIPDIIDEDIAEETERDKMVQLTVNEMGEPCSTLLDKYYWEKKSGDEIAVELNYKNSDTVKTQKYKCMQKLKQTFTKKLKQQYQNL